jgi:hypothetical protein
MGPRTSYNICKTYLLIYQTCRPILDPIASVFHKLFCGRSEAKDQALDELLPGSDSIMANRRRYEFPILVHLASECVQLFVVVIIHRCFLWNCMCTNLELLNSERRLYTPSVSFRGHENY